MAGRYTHTSEAGLIIFLPLMYCTPPPTLLDTNTLKRMVGGNSPPPNLQHCKMFYNRLASGIIHLEAAVALWGLLIINSTQEKKTKKHVATPPWLGLFPGLCVSSSPTQEPGKAWYLIEKNKNKENCLLKLNVKGRKKNSELINKDKKDSLSEVGIEPTPTLWTRTLTC